jgi:hypothetical protein
MSEYIYVPEYVIVGQNCQNPNPGTQFLKFAHAGFS